MEDAIVIMIERKKQTFCEKIVSDKYRNFIFPKRINGEKATAFFRIVYNVIMHKCCSMKDFYKGSGAVGRFGNLPAERGGKQHEHGPKLFSFALNYVPHDAVQQWGLTFHRVSKTRFENFKFVFN